MTGNEHDLLSMRETGMIDQCAFDDMWRELHSEALPSTEIVSLQGIKISSGAYSVKGKREHNEDSFFLGTETGGTKDTDMAVFSAEGDGPFFFAAADGMGGHDAGDLASAFVVMQLKQSASFQKTPVDDCIIEVILKGIHAGLLAKGRKRGTPKMGSTIAGIVLQKGNSGFFNIGDSRVYRLRHGYLQQISEDDSLVRFVPDAKKNIITNAVGAGLENMSVASRFAAGFAAAGDVFLMCSDGVHGAVNDEDITRMLSFDDNPQNIARIIVEQAVKNNSDDNCTPVVVKIEE